MVLSSLDYPPASQGDCSPEAPVTSRPSSTDGGGGWSTMKAIDPLLKVVEDHSHLADQHTISDKRAHGSRASNSTSNSTSGEEGYDSINSDEEVPVEVCLSGLSVISSGRLFVPDRAPDHGAEDDGFPTLGRGLCRTLSLNDADDSGVSGSSTASSAASSLSRGSGSPCGTPKGPPAFQELKVTSDLSSLSSTCVCRDPSMI